MPVNCAGRRSFLLLSPLSLPAQIRDKSEKDTQSREPDSSTSKPTAGPSCDPFHLQFPLSSVALANSIPTLLRSGEEHFPSYDLRSAPCPTGTSLALRTPGLAHEEIGIGAWARRVLLDTA